MRANYHTHSHYCDGKGELKEYVEEASNCGFTQLGFSAHAPVPFENKFAVSYEAFSDYCDEVRSLKNEYADRIKLFLGLEIDYIPGIMDDNTELMQKGNLDYCIGSVHMVNKDGGCDLWSIDGSRYECYDEGLRLVFGGDVKAGVKAFYNQNNEMISSWRPTIVGHFNKIEMHNRERYFHADEAWYVNLVNETLDLIHETSCICEINTRGVYKGRYPDYYPSKPIIKRMKELKIPVVVSTDAHQPQELSWDAGALEYLHSIDYPEIIETL